MSEEQKSAFYGDTERPPLWASAFSTLYAFTGSAECAVELIMAADEVERTCAGAACPSWLPTWCFDGSI